MPSLSLKKAWLIDGVLCHHNECTGSYIDVASGTMGAVGRVVTVDRNDGERTRLTKNSSRYEHIIAHKLWVSFEAALPHEHLSPSEAT